MSFKLSVHNACLNQINLRLQELEASISEAEEAMKGEIKSSMGDKYETSREIIQSEINKRLEVKSNLMEIKNNLSEIDPSDKLKTIQKGSLIATDKMIFYIAGSVGKVEVDGKSVMVISERAPIFETLKLFNTQSKVQFHTQEFQLLGAE